MAFVQSEIQDGILYLRLNRPEARNAYHPGMIAEICEALKTPARGAVVSGAGPTFCAGADLKWMAKAIDLTPEENLKDAMHLYSLYQAFWQCPCPTVVWAHGRVFGGGVGLTAVADFAVAEDTATFQLSEVKLGLIPGVATPFIIQRMGAKAFDELALSGREIGAKEALQNGLISFAGNSKDCADEIQRRLQDSTWSQRRGDRRLLDQAREYVVQIAEKRVSPAAKNSLAHFLKES